MIENNVQSCDQNIENHVPISRDPSLVLFGMGRAWLEATGIYQCKYSFKVLRLCAVTRAEKKDPGHLYTLVSHAGYVYTEEPVVRSFTRGGNLVLNVNVSDTRYARYISSLAWYHNGTEIVSGNKHTITNSDTTLRITNIAEGDAGTYEVKVRSISYDSERNSPICDSIVPPLFELHPMLQPVIFTVQESSPPTYDPSSIISIVYVGENAGSIRLNGTSVQYNSSISITQTRHNWFRNGIRLSDGGMYNSTGSLQEGLSLQIMYNNIADVTGDYVGVLWAEVYGISDLRTLCEGYYYYFRSLDFIFSGVFYLASPLWNIRGKLSYPLRDEM